MHIDRVTLLDPDIDHVDLALLLIPDVLCLSAEYIVCQIYTATPVQYVVIVQPSIYILRAFGS